MLITEPVIPLSEWLSSRLKQVVGSDVNGNEEISTTELQVLYNEVLWGFKCALHALRFLHEQMKCSHNYIMLSDSADGGAKFASLYVNRFTNEWKLGNLEFCCANGSAEDEAFGSRMHRHLPALSSRLAGSSDHGQFNASAGGDVQQLGALMTAVYGTIDQALSAAAAKREVCAAIGVGRGGVPTALITTLKKMTASSPVKTTGPSVDSVLRNCAMLRPVVPTVTDGNGANATTNVIYLMEFTDSLQQRIVPTLEALAFVQLLVDLAAVEPANDPGAKAPVGLHGLLSEATINYRVLPLIGVLFQYCIVEYNNRNTRELYRQAMQASLLLLSSLLSPRKCSISCTKISMARFHKMILPYYAQLFSINDRLIRTSLLKSVKDVQQSPPAAAADGDKPGFFLTEDFINNKQKVSLTINSVTTAQTTPANATISLTPVTTDPAAALVCNAIIDSVVLGFNDSSAKMREDTLKGLVPLLPHLSAANLNEKLALKYLVSLQQCETEAAIRTNCIILIGKIAHMLNAATRQRVLISCLVKALRDPFVHCRVAGLRTTQACLELLLDLAPPAPGAPSNATAANNVLTKLVPAISGMMLDSSVNISALALLPPEALAAQAGSMGGGRPNPFRDERELAAACINAIVIKVALFHTNVITPYESHQIALNAAASAGSSGSVSGAGGGRQAPAPAQSSPSRPTNPVAPAAASTAIAPNPVVPRQPQSPGVGVSVPAALRASQESASPGPGAVGGSWLGSLTDSLNRTLESATGTAADGSANVARTADINTQPQQSSSNTGSSLSLESLSVVEKPAAASRASAWDDDDFGDMDDEPAKQSSLGTKSAPTASIISKANAWGDDDDDFGDMDDEPAPAPPRAAASASAPVVGTLGAPVTKQDPAPTSRISVSATSLSPRGPVSAHDLGASLGAGSARPSAPDDTDVKSVSMEDFLSGSVEAASTTPQAKPAPAKGLTLGGISTVTRPPIAVGSGMGLAVPVRTPAVSGTGPASRPSTSSVKKIGVIKKVVKDTSKSKDDDWADF